MKPPRLDKRHYQRAREYRVIKWPSSTTAFDNQLVFFNDVEKILQRAGGAWEFDLWGYNVIPAWCDGQRVSLRVCAPGCTPLFVATGYNTLMCMKKIAMMALWRAYGKELTKRIKEAKAKSQREWDGESTAPVHLQLMGVRQIG